MPSDPAFQRVVLSGASGFLGRHVLEFLRRRGCEVVQVASRPGGVQEELLVWSGQIDEFVAEVVDFGPDLILHVAGHGTSDHQTADVLPTLDANLILGSAMLEAAIRTQAGSQASVPVVAVGSFWQFSGPVDGYHPNSLYAASKQALFDIAHYYRAVRGVPFVQLLPFDVFGPGANRPRFLDHVARAVHSGDSVDATGGEQLVSFVHVRDVARGVVEAASLASPDATQVFALRGETPKPLRSVVERLLLDTGLRVEINWGARPYRREEVTNPWPGRVLPGWDPRIDLVSGFLELVGER